MQKDNLIIQMLQQLLQISEEMDVSIELKSDINALVSKYSTRNKVPQPQVVQNPVEIVEDQANEVHFDQFISGHKAKVNALNEEASMWQNMTSIFKKAVKEEEDEQKMQDSLTTLRSLGGN